MNEDGGGEGDVDISGETTSLSNYDGSESEVYELVSGSSSSDGDEGGDKGHDVEMPKVMERGGDEEGLRDRVRSLEDLGTTL